MFMVTMADTVQWLKYKHFSDCGSLWADDAELLTSHTSCVRMIPESYCERKCPQRTAEWNNRLNRGVLSLEMERRQPVGQVGSDTGSQPLHILTRTALLRRDTSQYPVSIPSWEVLYGILLKMFMFIKKRDMDMDIHISLCKHEVLKMFWCITTLCEEFWWTIELLRRVKWN